MVYTKKQNIIVNDYKYKVSNRLYNIILNIMGEPDLEGFLFFKDDFRWYHNLRNSGKKTIEEITKLREELLSNKDNLSNVKTPNRISNTISIPSELYDIPLEKLMLFQNGSPKINKYIISFSKKYKNLGAIDGYSYDMLLKTKGIGVKVIGSIWDWFRNLYVSDFRDIRYFITKLNPNLKITDIYYSYYVSNLFDEYKITRLNQISDLDNIPKESITLENKLALLELRTLYEDGSGNLRTRANLGNKQMNLYFFIDSYFNSLDYVSQEIMQKRWGNKTITSLNIIGEHYNFTRERARQILKILTSDFIDEYFYDFNHTKNQIGNIFVKKLSYLELEDVGTSNAYEKRLNHNFYKNFFVELFHPIPFYEPFQATSVNLTHNNLSIINITKRELKDNSKIKLDTHLKRFDIDEQVELIKYINNPFGPLDLKGEYIVQSEYRSSVWDELFEKFKNFVNHNNKLPRADKRVKTTSKEELEIGLWFRRQIMYSRNGSLTSDRHIRLNGFWPDFDKKQRAKRGPWIEKYKKYKNFTEKYKREPNQKGDIEGEQPLGIWVSQNKQRYHGTSKNNSPLSDEQIELLNKINFDFSFSVRNDETWEDKFKQLRYMAPPNFSKTEIGQVLNSWVYQQKKSFKEGKLSKKRKAKLESIGINLSIRNREENWLNQLEEYLHLQKSNKLKRNRPLYDWSYRQRRGFQLNSLKKYQIIQLIENDILLPTDKIESYWDNYYHSAEHFLSNNENILKEIMGKPNELYTWLIYNYCMFKLGKLNDLRMVKFEKLDVKESIFD